MIRKAIESDAKDLALIHINSISEGFLPKLGKSFMSRLYLYLIKNEIVFCESEEGTIGGFVTCSINGSGMIRKLIVSNPFIILIVMWQVIRKPSMITYILETLRATKYDPKTEIKETHIELLSIAVVGETQKKGIGTGLVNALEQELASRNIIEYKVVAGDKLIGANKFYQRNGFKLLRQTTIHDNESSNVYVKKLNRDL